MRIWVLLCCAVIVGQFASKYAKRFDESPAEPCQPIPAAPAVLESESAQPVARAREPGLLSLLTLGVAVLGAVSNAASSGPYDADAQLAARIVETTAQLEAASSRIADHRQDLALARP